MERDITFDTYLTLSKKSIDKTKKKATEESFANVGEEGKDDLYYADSTWNVDELYFEKDTQTLNLSGEITCYGEKIGYFSPLIKLSNETVIEIIEHYMKKLGKLKTVLEAIKD